MFFQFLVIVAAFSQVLALDCSKLDLSLVTKTCCKVPPKDLITPTMVKKCSSDKTLHKWFNGFMANKMLKSDGTLDLKSTKNNPLLCKVVPFINCVLIEFGIVDKDFNTYNGEAVFTKLMENSREQFWIEEGFPVVTEVNALEYITEKYKFNISCTVKRKTTNHYVGMLFPVQYFLGYLNMVCQEPISNTKCDKLWNNFHECHDLFESNSYAENKAVYKLSEPIRDKLRKMGKRVLNLNV